MTFVIIYFTNEVVFVSSKVPFVAAILAGVIAVGGTGYFAYQNLSNIHNDAVSQAQASMVSYHEDYQKRMSDNAAIAEHNAVTERTNQANKRLSDYRNNPDVENKDGNYVHPYFTEDDKGIWIYDVKNSDVIKDIANSANMTVDDLLKYNDAVDIESLYHKKVIHLPSQSVTQSDLRCIGVWRVGVKPEEHG